MSVSAWNGYYPIDTVRGIDAEIQLDPYYSAADLVFSLNQSSVEHLRLEGEETIYPYLIKNFFNFRDLLIEGSVYPFPWLGAMIYENKPQWYQNAQMSPGLNLVRTLSMGFPEPWAQSFFLGNVVNIVNSSDSVIGRGYAGVLASWGLTHIAWNRFVSSPWVELESKLKGSYQYGPKELSYSFGVGYKEHWNSDIVDLLRLSLKRSRTDKDVGRSWSIIENSFIEIRGDLDRSQAFDFWNHWKTVITHASGIVGKKWPVKSGVWILDLGLSYDGSSGYKGSLALEDAPGWTVIIRPNFEF